MTLNLPERSGAPVKWLAERPIAHRGLHNEADGIYENTLEATQLAVEQNYAIEVDLQPSADRVAMVFHDYTLERMAGDPANIRDQTADQLQSARICNGNSIIAPLSYLLGQVDGRVPLVLELKGQFGADDGFVDSVVRELSTYDGSVVLMSFNHWLLSEVRELAPQVSLGLVAEGGNREYGRHREITEICNLDFISYHWEGLDCRFVHEYRATGRPVICWTIRSPEEARQSLQIADQITFEGFSP